MDTNLGYHLTLKTVSLLPGKLWQPMEEVWEVWLFQRVMWCEEHDLLRKSSQSLDSGGFTPQGTAKPTQGLAALMGVASGSSHCSGQHQTPLSGVTPEEGAPELNPASASHWSSQQLDTCCWSLTENANITFSFFLC